MDAQDYADNNPYKSNANSLPAIPPYQAPCPNCGRCPTCGRGGHQYLPYPTYPYYAPYQPFTVTCGNSAGPSF